MIDDVTAINALIEALKYYRENFISSAYSTMGFTAVAIGWLITSRSARLFLHSHRWLSLAAVIMIIISYAGYWELSLRVQSLSQGIANKLSAYPAAQGLYEHYTLSLAGVHGFILIQGLATGFIILVMVAILRDPGKE
jgi:hypothetical protein